MELVDRMHTLLASDCRLAGDTARENWHITTRDNFRRALDLAASIFCQKPVSGYLFNCITCGRGVVADVVKNKVELLPQN